MSFLSLLLNLTASPTEQFIAAVLGRLIDVDPQEGRAPILEERRRPHPRLDLRFVKLLPDKRIPELDDPLAENLEASVGIDPTVVELIGRYATPAIFPRVRAVLESQVGQVPCEAQASFLAYALESDRPSGAQMPGSLGGSKGHALRYLVLGEVAARHMAAEIEQAAIASLSDPDTQVGGGAAATLGRYGSPDAEQPLWGRLEQWHAAWAALDAGREAKHRVCNI